MTLRQMSCRIAAGAVLLLSSSAYADVVISSATTQNMSCSGGVCMPTSSSAVLNVGDLETLLASGNVEVTTTGSGVQANNIDVAAPLSWSATNTLALDAYQSISVTKAVTVTGTGGLSVTTNDGGSNGVFVFGAKGSITFKNLSSQLVIGGKTFTLEKSLPALATAVTSNPAGSYALANNYDASKDGYYHASPIGELSGVIEGLGNTISHLSISVKDQDDSETAMVQIVEPTGAIEHLHLSNLHVLSIGPDNAVAGMVVLNEGYLFGDSAVGRIAVSGKGLPCAGGLVCSSSGTIVSSWANVKVTALQKNGWIGGLVADNSGTIELSYAEGAVSGGLVGGFVGVNIGAISQSFATGAVDGGTAGGFIGQNTSDPTNGTIANSYATGNVTGGNIGGFVSTDEDRGNGISYSYSTGTVPAQGGGFVCDPYPSDFTDNYWDTTTSGTTYGVCGELNFSGAVGLTTAQLQSGLPTGFDSSIWAQDKKINNGFPYLIANPPPKK